MKTILFTLTLIFTLIGCGSSFEAQQEKPFQAGKATGTLVPVVPVSPKPIITGKKQKTEVKTTEFRNLQFEMNLEDTHIDGELNLEALINISLTGTMLSETNKQSAINFNKDYNRFDPETKTDKLEDSKRWAFRLVSVDEKFVADVMCVQKWDCKTIVANFYWYEGEILKYRQFHIEGTYQNQRIEVESPEQDDDHELEDVADQTDDHNHNDDELIVEGRPENETVSEYRFTLYKWEDFIQNQKLEDSQDVEDSESNEQKQDVAKPTSPNELTVEEIDSETLDTDITNEIRDMRSTRPDTATTSMALPFNMNAATIDLDRMVFDFNSTQYEPINASDLPVQAIDCHSPSTYCATGGHLQNSTELEDVPFNIGEFGTVPYFIENNYEAGNYATELTVNLLKAVSEEVLTKTGKSTVYGDMSLENGGQYEKHGSHRTGLDVDISLFTKDNANVYSVNNDNLKNFDTKTNFEYLKVLFNKAKVYESATEQDYSYITAIFTDQKIKDNLCEHAKKTEPEAFSDPKSDIFQLLRRLIHVSGHHHHYHLRLSCHTEYCRDSAVSLPESNGCK